jgi:mannonate dehydratase
MRKAMIRREALTLPAGGTGLVAAEMLCCGSRGFAATLGGEPSPRKPLDLVANRYIDFIRCHQSAVSGLNMCRKIAHMCEFFDVRTAWHGPNNVDPVGHCDNMHLDLVAPNFGIQEETVFSDKAREVFPGDPEIRGGYMYSNDKPGLGIDIDEAAAAKYPCNVSFETRGKDRLLNETIVRS